MLQEPPNGSDKRLTTFERGEEIRAAFLHPSPPVISLTLIFLNVAWFVPEVLLSVRYQLPLNNAWLIRADAMVASRQNDKDLLGIRGELRRKF